MPKDLKQVLADPNFQGLPEEEKLKVLAVVDPNFPEHLKPKTSAVSTGTGEKLTKPDFFQSMGPVGEFAREAIRMAPEAIGSIGGGVVGAGVGAPAGPAGSIMGASAGSGIGAGAGQGLTQLLGRMFPQVFGNPPKTAGESINKIGESVGYGMLSEAGGRGLATALKGAKVFPRKLPGPVVDNAVQTLEREGVPYTAGNVRPKQFASKIENLERGSLLGGSVMTKFDLEQAKKLMAFKVRTLDGLGKDISNEQLGNILKGSVETRAAELEDMFEILYGKMDQLYQAPVVTSKVRARVQPLLEQLQDELKPGRLPSANPPKDPSKFMALMEDLSKYGTKEAPPTPASTVLGPNGMPVTPAQGGQLVDVPINYSAAWRDKQKIDQYLRGAGDDVLRDRGKGILKQLHTIIDDAMESSAQTFDKTGQAAARIRKVNAAYGQAKELMETESAVAAMRKGDYDPEVLVGKFFKPGVVTPTKELMRAIPQDQKRKLLPYIQRKSIQNLFEPSTKILDDGTEITSAISAESRFRKAKEALATHMTPDQMSGIQEFLNASKVAQSTSRLINPTSGFAVLQYAQLAAGGWALKEASEGDFSGAAMTSLGIIAPQTIAKILVHPAAAKMLSQGLTISRKRAEQIGFLPRLANLIRLNQEGAPEDEQK